MCSGKALEDMNLDELDELEDEEEEKILLQMRFVSRNHIFTVFLIKIRKARTVLDEFGS
jgi:hypothetical protein